MLGCAARTSAVTRRIQALAQLNIELAKAEGKQKATALGVAGALGAVAAVLVIYGIGFALATAAAGLSEAFPLWLSLLIVTVDHPGARRDGGTPRPKFSAQGVATEAGPSDRGSAADGRGFAKPCLSGRPRRSAWIAAERQALDEDLSNLQSEIRSLAVFVAAGLVVVGLVSWRKGRRKGTGTVWKLVK